MIRATRVRPQGARHDKTADTVVLDYEDRHRRRATMTCVNGLEFLLDLADTPALRNGDALLLEDGRLVEVVAAPETLHELRVAQPLDLVKLAWHLGNRHLTMEVAGEKKLRIRRDPVVAEMAAQLGAKVMEIEAAFDPEGGAYAQAAAHDHAHHDHHGHDHHDHGHAHDHHSHDHHGHDHGAHANPAHGHEGHVHDEHCDHDHAHGSHAHDHDDHAHHGHDHDHKH